MYELSVITAQQHRADLLAEAARHRLVAIATCCRPSTWRRALQRLRPQPAAC
jgi:hypothetical protein